jgi:uncharacterized RDD family membrane protein YckC
MARATASWLSGPESAEPGPETDYPGKRLGLPAIGPRSLAGWGRRILALFIDWFISVGLFALGVPLGLMTTETVLYDGGARGVQLLIWLLLGTIAVRLFGFTPGQYALGLAVARLDPGRHGALLHVGVVRALFRTLLIVPVVPVLFTDADGRGLHDRLTGTLVIRR